MEKVILVRPGELTLKGKNKIFFENKLIENISRLLKQEGFEFKLRRDHNRIYIFSKDENINKIQEEIFFISGIKSTSLGLAIQKDIREILNAIREITKDKRDLKINLEVKRSDKNFHLKSPEVISYIIRELTEELKQNNILFSRNEFDLTLYIEIQNKYIIVGYNKVNGIGGLPKGTLGKGLVLLSGGIDSPVAAVLSIKRGLAIDTVFFDTKNDINYNKGMENLIIRLKKFDPELKFFYIPFYKFHNYVFSKLNHKKEFRYGCVICKRGMIYLANQLAKKKNKS